MDGYINLLKPIGPSSFQAVQEIRRILGEKKVGHTGTLDPGAAGVLPLCIGKATKAIPYLNDDFKSYRAEITFGITTDTQDIYGTILRERKVRLDEKEIEQLLHSFRGKIIQVPPMFSALKVKGRKLYELAREGMEVDRKPREICIESIELVEMVAPDKALFDVRCSKGTYIRALCHDIGEKAGCGAVMSYLVRTSSGGFHMDSAVTIEEVVKAKHSGCINSVLLPVDHALFHLDKAQLAEDSKKYALNGNPLKQHNMITSMERYSEGQRVRIYCSGLFIGIGMIVDRTDGRHIKMVKVF
ncbi:MAG: tRNA pseudouridine(55) synthase [Firmicutes bacterium]|nr:tRNA pseudouridine(55) synthase [Bacillota bacterium]MDI6704723.1 tRNA pseudouridine(55) synthase TruB [Bacillota bacterium]